MAFLLGRHSRESRVKEIRTIVLKRHVFGESDLSRMLEIFDDQVRLADASKHSFNSEQRLMFYDGTRREYNSTHDAESANADRFQRTKPSDILTGISVRITGIRCAFVNRAMDRMIEIDLYQNPFGVFWSHPASTVTVSSMERAWLNDVYVRLEQVFDGCRRQVRWPLFVAMGLQLLVPLLVVNAICELAPAMPHGAWSILGPAIAVLVMLLSVALTPMASFLWPPVELDVGPEHQKIEKRRRSFLGTIFVLVLVPLALQLILS